MIVDCHTHINNYHQEEIKSLQGSLDDLQLQMRKNRVDIALVLTSYKITRGRPSARDAVMATRDLDSIYIVAGISYLNYSQDYLRELREYIKDGSVRGLKLYPGYEPFYPNDPHLKPVYKLAREFKIPVMIHSGDTYSPTGKIKYSHPIHIDEVAVDYPDVNFVICHIGNPWIRDCMEVVYKNKNVYTDISGLVLGNFSDRFEQFMRKQLQEMLLYGVEPENVLYGSDWPISSMESYLLFMEELSIPPADKRKIMYENAVKLFRLPVKENTPAKKSLLSWLR